MFSPGTRAHTHTGKREAMEVLVYPIVVIISQYVHVLNHHIEHLKFTQCYNISIKLGGHLSRSAKPHFCRPSWSFQYW